MATSGEKTRERKNGSVKLPRGRPLPLPNVPISPRYLVEDLEAETGFNRRTIRYYVSKGLLAPAHGRGPTATYDKDHLLRLNMIKELKAKFLPLEAIKHELENMGTDDLEDHFAIQSGPTEGQWRRIEFGPDIELHVRVKADSDYRYKRMVDQIVHHTWAMVDSLEEIT